MAGEDRDIGLGVSLSPPEGPIVSAVQVLCIPVVRLPIKVAKVREQWIRLSFAAPSGAPDASGVARRFMALLRLLQSVDRRISADASARYRWEISSASMSSPLCIRIDGRPVAEDSPEADVVGALTDGLAALEREADPALLTSTFGSSDLTDVLKLARSRRGQLSMQFSLQFEKDGALREYEPGSQLAAHARRLRRSPEAAPPEEYVVREGLLRTITADPTTGTHALVVVDRDSGSQLECVIRPGDADTLGAHVGHMVFVEGWLSRGRGRPKLKVEAFHLVSKGPIPLEEVRRRQLRVPDGQSAEGFVRSLRSEVG